MYVIVGLGNPGEKYQNTRHNVGFVAIDYLAERLGAKINKIKHKALIGECRINGEKVILVKPQTYMNLSGNSVREIMEYYKLPIENLLVIYDDIDLKPGNIRIRKKGSSGTHNGMRSIIYDLKTDEFPRIRIGIGKNNNMPLANFVIGGFSSSEIDTMKEAVINTADAIECLIKNDIDLAMNKFNKKKNDGEKNCNE